MWVWCPFKFAIFCNFYSHEPISHKFTFKLFENLKSTLIHYNHRNGILVIFHKVPENWNFSSFLSQFSIPSWSEKGHEPSWKSFSSSYGSSQLGSTSTNFIPMAIKFVLVKIVLVETVLVGDPLYRWKNQRNNQWENSNGPRITTWWGN